jgi:hypothetical protein
LKSCKTICGVPVLRRRLRSAFARMLESRTRTRMEAQRPPRLFSGSASPSRATSHSKRICTIRRRPAPGSHPAAICLTTALTGLSTSRTAQALYHQSRRGVPSSRRSAHVPGRAVLGWHARRGNSGSLPGPLPRLLSPKMSMHWRPAASIVASSLRLSAAPQSFLTRFS